jgi:hypothetical protein
VPRRRECSSGLSIISLSRSAAARPAYGVVTPVVGGFYADCFGTGALLAVGGSDRCGQKLSSAEITAKAVTVNLPWSLEGRRSRGGGSVSSVLRGTPGLRHPSALRCASPRRSRRRVGPLRVAAARTRGLHDHERVSAHEVQRLPRLTGHRGVGHPRLDERALLVAGERTGDCWAGGASRGRTPGPFHLGFSRGYGRPVPPWATGPSCVVIVTLLVMSGLEKYLRMTRGPAPRGPSGAEPARP